MTKKKLYFITNQDKLGINLALENKNDEVTICLLQDAVFNANKAVDEIKKAIDANKTVIACSEDIKTRGLNKYIFPQVKLMNYGEIIDLILANDSIVNA